MLSHNSIKNYIVSWYGYILSIFLSSNELKITVLGLQNSGKSSFVNLLNGKKFEEDNIPTIGMQYSKFKLESTLIKCYDLGGQARFEPLWRTYYHNTDLIIYIIDLSDIDRLKESRKRLLKIIEDTNKTDIPILILGNKIDLSRKINKVETLANFLGIDYRNSLSLLFVKKDNPEEDLLITQFKNNDQTANNGKNILNQGHKNSVSSYKYDEIEMDSYIILERDVGIFLSSFKTRDGFIDIVKWIVGRDL